MVAKDSISYYPIIATNDNTTTNNNNTSSCLPLITLLLQVCSAESELHGRFTCLPPFIKCRNKSDIYNEFFVLEFTFLSCYPIRCHPKEVYFLHEVVYQPSYLIYLQQDIYLHTHTHTHIYYKIKFNMKLFLVTTKLQMLKHFFWTTMCQYVGACYVTSVVYDSLQPHGRHPPGTSVCGILQARILQQVAISFSTASSRSRDQTCVSYVPCNGRRVLCH